MVATRTQVAFDNYLDSDEVKANKQQIIDTVDGIRSLHVFALRINRHYSSKFKCELGLVLGDTTLVDLGSFSNAIQIRKLADMYQDTLFTKLNTRIVFQYV